MIRQFFMSEMVNGGKFGDYQIAKTKLRGNTMTQGIIAFGSARLPENDPHIKEVEEISELCAKRIIEKNKKISFITGGGPSVMTAWLKPAYKLGVKTSSLSIKLPFEEEVTPYADERYSFSFETFESRKAIMYKYSRAAVIFKGGFGTMDELFTLIVLIHTGRLARIPIFVYPADFYKDVLNFKNFIDGKTIDEEEGKILKFCNTKQELLDGLYSVIDNS